MKAILPPHRHCPFCDQAIFMERWANGEIRFVCDTLPRDDDDGHFRSLKPTPDELKVFEEMGQ